MTDFMHFTDIAETLAALGAAGVPVPGAAAASALPWHHRSFGKGSELLLEHQLYLKSREALQREE